jgi:hypothetical protein
VGIAPTTQGWKPRVYLSTPVPHEVFSSTSENRDIFWLQTDPDFDGVFPTTVACHTFVHVLSRSMTVGNFATPLNLVGVVFHRIM